MVLILVDLFPFKQIYQSADGVTTNRAWSGQAFQKNKEKKKDTKKSKAGDRLCPTKLKSGTSYHAKWSRRRRSRVTLASRQGRGLADSPGNGS